MQRDNRRAPIQNRFPHNRPRYRRRLAYRRETSRSQAVVRALERPDRSRHAEQSRVRVPCQEALRPSRSLASQLRR